ncbi:hypothetical protein VLF92_09355 [Pseudomonas chengduensis]
MEIIFVTLLLVFGGLLWLGLIAIALGAYYLLGRLILKKHKAGISPTWHCPDYSL